MTYRHNGIERPVRILPPADTPPAPLQHRLWSSFHQQALADAITPDWLARFNRQVAALPICDCATHWLAILAARPLPATGQFEWSVDCHNDVNAPLGKPLHTLDQARAIWSPA